MLSNYSPIQIIIADDHEIFRDGLKIMLKKISDVELVGEAENGQELIKLARKLKPDVVITDIRMPLLDGIEATKQLSKEFPDIGIIALSMFEDENLIIDMLEAGAKGYLIKNAHKDEITKAIKSVYKGQNYYCTSTTRKLALMIAKSDFNPYKKVSIPEFSEQELRIIRFICQEFTNIEIGEKLDLSRRTVEGYRIKILEKMRAKNSAGIVVFAIKNKIFEVVNDRTP